MRKLLVLLVFCLPNPVLAARPHASTVKTKFTTRLDALHTATQQGSGTVVSKDATGFYVVTCKHCITGDNPTGLDVITHDHRSYPAKVLFHSTYTDLALLKASGGGAESADVEVAKLVPPGLNMVGVKMIKCGHAHDARDAIVLGGVFGGDFSNDETTGAENWILPFPSIPGDSGCGLYRASDHAFVGVVWGCIGGRLRAVPPSLVRHFLQETKVKLTFMDPTKG